jgi:hypothetical protein
MKAAILWNTVGIPLDDFVRWARQTYKIAQFNKAALQVKVATVDLSDVIAQH